jgi:hypothetical protein
VASENVAMAVNWLLEPTAGAIPLIETSVTVGAAAARDVGVGEGELPPHPKSMMPAKASIHHV